MRIDNLICFQAVENHLNFSKAAESLYISQSALSKQLKAMEDELGVVLFKRRHTGVTLTSAGEQVALYVKSILHEYDKMKLTVSEYKENAIQKLRIISFCEMAQYGITDLIVSYEQRYGNFYVESAECAHALMFNLLTAKRTDLLIGYREFFPVKIKYEVIPLTRDDLVLVVNRNNHLAQKSRISLEEVRGEKFCFPREDVSLFEFYNSTCKSAGFLPKLTLSDVRLGTIKRYITANMRVTLQTRMRAVNFFHEPEFSVLNIEGSPQLTLCIVTDEKLLSWHGKQFVDFAQSYYRALRLMEAPDK